MNDLQSNVPMIVFLTISLIITRLVSRVRKQAKEALSRVSYKVIKGEERERQTFTKTLVND